MTEWEQPQPAQSQPPYQQPPYQAPYQQPYPPYFPTQARVGTNGLAIASLVLGIVWLWGLGSLLALIFGIVALRQIRQRGDGGKGLAIAGTVLGGVGLAGVLLLTLVLVLGSTVQSKFNNTCGQIAGTQTYSSCG